MSSPSAASAQLLTDALQRILARRHAAVYAYPVIGVHLTSGSQIQLARTLQEGHRASRDDLMAIISGRQAIPVASEVSYWPPEPVKDATAALRWAVQIEEGTASAYRWLLTATVQAGGDQQAFRLQGQAGLTAAARASAQWRASLTPATPTVAFPGL
jgi:hypothetical protein